MGQPESPRSPIAIVGVSALFPGSLDSTGFWSDILEGRDLIRDVPPTHWLVDDYYDADHKVPDKTYAKRGAFLGNVDFDALAWGIPPSILSATDTSQLLALIVAQRVLEDATRGQFKDMDRDRVSVILGVTSAQELLASMVARLQRPVWVKSLREAGLPEEEVQAICERISSHYAPWQEATFPGLLGNVVAGRIANRLDLGGTNCVTDAACASTFSAMSMAVNELQLGQSDLVVCGGVDTMNDIFMYMCFSKTPALSPSGDCRPFSDKADGTMLGEGIGMVAIKRLADAERDGDRIYAVLQGLGSSSDGRAKSVYAPLPQGQAKALRRAYELAGYGPETVELMEAHGTGTKAGDAAEFEGLATVWNESGRDERQWCALGSVKSQIGHTKAAAGAAGIFKVIMALHHKVIPPTVKVDRPNPALRLEQSPFYLNTRARPWVRGLDHLRRGSVSSFGFGGSNFHLALEEYVGPAERAGRLRTRRHEIVAFSGTADEIRDQAATLRARANVAGTLAWASWSTAQRFDPKAPARLAIVAETEAELDARLGEALDRIAKDPSSPFSLPTGVHYGVGPSEGPVAFLFPGQGSQYIDMTAALAMQDERALEAWDRAADLDVFADAPLHDVVFPHPVFDAEGEAALDAKLTSTEWAQPAIGASSLSLLHVLKALGVTPSAVGGHSFGEVMALHCAGVMTATDALKVARRRGELMRDAASVPGAMTAVVAEIEKVTAAVGSIPVVVANHNSPTQVVLSGTVAAIESAEGALKTAGLKARRLPVATAFHSPVVAASAEPFGRFLDGVSWAAPTVPVYANASAAVYPSLATEQKALLASQIARPVRFVEQVRAMHDAGARIFVEVGPQAVLTALVGKILEGRPHRAVALDRKGAAGLKAFALGVAELAAAGVPLRLQALWENYRAPIDMLTIEKPKVSVAINGSNYGKPYPPAEGAVALPKPNGPRENAVRVVEKVVEKIVEVPVATAMPAAGGPAAGGNDAAWVQAYQEAQRQTAEAHAAYQKAMADAHVAFLKSAEIGMMGLVQMVGQPGAAFGAQPAAFSPPPAPMFTAPPPVLVAPPPVVVAPPPVLVKPAAPPAKVAAPTPIAKPATDLTALLLSVVADKTGYPAEMLQLTMDLEGDLGIDSIKRVEILSAMREREPNLPEVDAGAMAQLRTLGQIVESMGSVGATGTQPSAVSPAKAAPAAQTTDLTALLMSVVADKTGYPAEMLQLSMDLEGDLGIDSIKRVEILSAMREREPNLPEVDAGAMAQLRTLGQIVESMGAVATISAPLPAVVAPPPAPVAALATDLTALLMAVVADKTGYPAEMLQLKMDLEGDLGIDSIKRVEILSAMREREPNLPEVDAAAMAQLRTLGQIVESMGATSTSTSTSTPTSTPTSTSTPPPAPVALDPRLGRFVLRAIPAPAIGMATAGLRKGKIAITDDGTGLAESLIGVLKHRGVSAELVRDKLAADMTGLVFLGGLRAVRDEKEAVAVNREAFRWAKAVAATFAERGGIFVTVQDTGGQFGLGGGFPRERAFLGGIAGLAKTAAQEWPKVVVKAIDLARDARTAGELALVLADELLAGGPELEVGLLPEGERITLGSTRVDVAPAPSVIDADSVVVATGGARGVTAATLIELARSTKAKVALVGRTPLEEESIATRDVQGDAALKRTLLEKAKLESRVVTPAEVGQAVARIQANREVKATLAAIEAAGSKALYVAADATDDAALGKALDRVRSELGPITVLVHGAGVLADKRIADKTIEQFDRVFDTKVEGLRTLLRLTAKDPIDVLALFSSVAGRCGNAGQCDYAMANEILNKLAQVERQERGIVVKSFGWGPWAGGMVTPELAAVFEGRGIPLIPLDVGARMFVDELTEQAADEVELVLGGEPKPKALATGEVREVALDIHVDRASHPYLQGHAIEGMPVVPVVLVVEWFARAARAYRPDLQLEGVHDLKVLKGIRLEHYNNGGDRFTLKLRQLSNGDGVIVGLELLGSDDKPRYAATAQLVHRRRIPAHKAPLPALDDWGGRPIYGDVLFHGPTFQVITGMDGVSKDGIAARLEGVRTSGWSQETWRTDAAAFDGGLQLALLWSDHVLGGKSLPTSIEQVKTWTDEATHGPLQAVLTKRDLQASRTKSDVRFLDSDGNLVAELLGVETHLLPRG